MGIQGSIAFIVRSSAKPVRMAAALLAAGVIVGSPSDARAASVGVSLGPLPLPDLPIEVCIESTCITSPELSAAALDVTVATSGLVLPIIIAGLCPDGQVGATLSLSSLIPTQLTVEAVLSGELPNGDPFSESIGPVTLPTGLLDSATLSFCAEP